MSFRDIGTIVHEQEKKQQVKEVQAQQQYLSSQAYRLFSKCKTPVQVGIELNLRQPDVATLYKEYCKLTQLENLSRVYEELKHDIEPFLELYRLTKAAGMIVHDVSKVLAVANNYLPTVQIRYDGLKREIDVLEGDKRNAAMIFQDLNNQIITMGKTLDSYRLECQKEKEELEYLQEKRMKLEALVRQFENNNEEYNKIRKTAGEKVNNILSDKKELLGRAVFCVTESIRKDPDKYGPLYYNDDNNNAFSIPPPISHVAAYYNREYYPSSYTYSQGQQHYLTKDSFKQGYIDMLNEESEKLFTSLEKMLVGEVIDQYISKTPPLPMLPPEQKQ
jgi:hypothetical protein